MGEMGLAAVKVEELLKEVRVDYHCRTQRVQRAIAAVSEIILRVPDQEVSSFLASAFIKDLGVPDEKAFLRFRKPESVEVIGSYRTRTLAKPVLNVDVAVRIPKVCFQEKDFLNHRYHAKRMLYLATLERSFRNSPAIARVQWSAFNQDARKPVLVLHPATEESGTKMKFAVRIIPTISTNVFESAKLALGRNNVREVKNNEGFAQPTPYYNTGIIEDSLIEKLSVWLEDQIGTSSSALCDAICLVKVWLRQRSMQGRSTCLSGFLVSVLMVHLSTSAGKFRITEHMSSLQAFRVTLEAICGADILGKGIFLGQAGKKDSSDQRVLMKTLFDVVLCDPSGCLNLAHRVSKSALSELRHDAGRALEAMKGVKDGGFDSVFMTPSDFAEKFDYHVRLDLPSAPQLLPCCLDKESWGVYEKEVEELLVRSLGDRAYLVRVMQRFLPLNWEPSQGLKAVGEAPIFAGILLNSIDVALRMADIGPGADDKEEAKRFRAFWGERSELRRFKDGRICETAVWETEPWKRHLIIEQIISHVLCRHLSLSPANIKVSAGQLDFALLIRGNDQVSVMPKVLETFEILSKRLRAIDNLPLKVVIVQPLSAVLRHTAVYYPQPHPLADGRTARRSMKALGACLDPLEVVLQLEGSGRWPDDPVAIQKTKVAFCLKIAEKMGQLSDTVCIASEDAVDLLMQGFAFRLNILYDKDPTLLSKERISSSFSTRSNISLKFDSGSSKPLAPSLKGDLLLRSLHASSLHGLHGVYPAFSPTVRLVKRWLGSHLLSGDLYEEAVELLVAYLFVRPFPYVPPSSRITGFLRFLQLIVKHDWALAPLIVDINGDLTSRDHEIIQAQFDGLRESRPAQQHGSTSPLVGPAMYIATAYDMGSETWTRFSPKMKSLKRLVAYAKSSAALLSCMINGEGDLSGWQSLFRTSLDVFDMVVLLHHESLPHPSRVLFPSVVQSKPLLVKEAPEHILSLIPESEMEGVRYGRCPFLIGFNPVVLFVDELRNLLGESCHIWYDSIGSDVVGLTLSKPLKIEKPAKFKRKKVEKGTFSHVRTLITEIALIGEGLVRSIHSPERVFKPL